MALSTIKNIMLVGVAAISLAACTSTPPPRGPSADVTFTRMAPVALNVAIVDVLVREPSANQPPIAPFQVTPAQALKSYAERRLQAAGGRGSLNFIIEQATVKVDNVAPDTKVEKAFAFNESQQYTVTMRIGLDLVDRGNLPTVRSAYTLERKITIPGHIGIGERDRQLNQFLVQMVEDMDVAVQRGLRDNMNIALGSNGIAVPAAPMGASVGGVEQSILAAPVTR